MNENMIGAEDGRRCVLERIVFIASGAVVGGFTLSAVVFLLVWRPGSIVSGGLETTVLFLIMVTLSHSFAIWLILTGLRRVRLKVYEDGFEPQRVPFNKWLRRERWFVTWDEIRSIKFQGPGPRYGAGWVYYFILEDGKGVSLSSWNFKDGGMDVFKKLRKVEEELNKRRLQETYEGPILYDA